MGNLEDNERTELARSMCALLRELAEALALDHTLYRDFHSRLWAELILLENELFCARDSHPRDTERESTQQLLQFLESNVVEVREVQGSGAGRRVAGQTETSFAGIVFICARLKSPFATEQDRRAWLQQRIWIDRMRGKEQDGLLSLLRDLRKAIQTNAAKSHKHDSDTKQKAQDMHAEFAELMFKHMEQLHIVLSRQWVLNCHCPATHSLSRLSIGWSTADCNNSQFWLAIPTTGDPTTEVWRLRKISVEQRRPDQTIVDSAWNAPLTVFLPKSQTKAKDVRFQPIHSASAKENKERESLYDLNASSTLRLCFQTRPISDFTGVHSTVEFVEVKARSLKTSERISQCCIRPQSLSLAIRLSYAYLYLSGGPLWPYNRFDMQIGVFRHELDLVGDVSVPFFLLSSSGDPAQSLHPWSLGHENEFMPNLPAFGKMLLETLLDEKLDVADFQPRLASVHTTAFGLQIKRVIETCLLDEALTAGGTIRDDERLRESFHSEVIKPLEDFLRIAWPLEAERIFKSVDPAHDLLLPVSSRAGFVAGEFEARGGQTMNNRLDRMSEPFERHSEIGEISNNKVSDYAVQHNGNIVIHHGNYYESSR